jgi:hypothetical protein
MSTPVNSFRARASEEKKCNTCGGERKPGKRYCSDCIKTASERTDSRRKLFKAAGLTVRGTVPHKKAA